MSLVFRSRNEISATTAERRWLRFSVTVSIRSYTNQWFNELQSQHYQHCSIVKLSLKCADWPLTTTRPLSARATSGKVLTTDLSRSSISAPTFEARRPAIKRSRSRDEQYIAYSTRQRRNTMWRQTCWQEEKSSPYEESYLHFWLTKWCRLKVGAILTVAWTRGEVMQWEVKLRGLRADEDRDGRKERRWECIIRSWMLLENWKLWNFKSHLLNVPTCVRRDLFEQDPFFSSI